MQSSNPNLFQALFEFRPREGHWPKENFLTEAFAYLLRTDDAVQRCWLSCLFGREIEEGTVCEVSTRQTERDVETDRSVYPDLLLEGHFVNGPRFAVYCEHKWDSPFNEPQLKKYRKIADAKGDHACLSFVGANLQQRSAAEKCFPDKACKCFLWEDVYRALDGLADKSTLLKEFLDFMKSHGLSPAPPLTVERMTAFLQASDFIPSLNNLANRLDTNYSWEVVPKRYHAKRYVHDAYGRVGIRFESEEWRPGVVVGFLYDESDHKVSFVNRDKGIDLLLRIEAYPKDTKNLQPAVAILEEKRKVLRKTAASVLLKGERGNGNAYSVLIVRDSLADVIEKAKTVDDQLAVIYERLTTWLRVLFDDGSLEKAFKKCGLDSGMK